MKKFKGIPGPWYIWDEYRPGIETCPEGNNNLDSKSIVVLGLEDENDWCGVQGETKQIRLANAKLIAAAPDLLVALQNCLLLMKHSQQYYVEYEAAEAAINKALS